MATQKFTCPVPASGEGTFSDGLVGLQLVDGGGFTQANFAFTTSINEKQNRTFNIGTFSYANLINSFAMITKYTLKIVDDLEPNKHQDIKIKNFKASDYFDVSYNYWNLTNTKEALIKVKLDY